MRSVDLAVLDPRQPLGQPLLAPEGRRVGMAGRLLSQAPDGMLLHQRDLARIADQPALEVSRTIMTPSPSPPHPRPPSPCPLPQAEREIWVPLLAQEVAARVEEADQRQLVGRRRSE